MIVKNEEEVLSQCLSSVAELCDEIIIVDTGSTDATKRIAKKFTNRVYDFEWIDDFSAARNFSFSKATMDYIFWIDADDVLPKDSFNKFKILKSNLDNTVDAVSMLYHIAFDENGNSTFSYMRNRIVKRSLQAKWIGFVHEYLEVYGNIINSDIAIYHKKMEKKKNKPSPSRNLEIYEKRLQQGTKFSPRDLFYYGNELKDHKQYEKAIKYYHEFLNSKKGWIEDEIRSCINLADCYRHLGEPEREIETLVMSIMYDVPRPEVSCRLGDLYKNKNLWKKAIIWYELALHIDTQNTLGFQKPLYSTWYPHLQLCVCYWNLGQKEMSFKHHLKAKAFNPANVQIQQNDKFFIDNHFFKTNK